MNGSVVDFICLKLSADLDKYRSHPSQSSDLIEGTLYTINDIHNCMNCLSPLNKVAAKKLIKMYQTTHDGNYDKFLEDFRKVYYATLVNLKTQSKEFMFPTTLSEYREGINPIVALYYEVKFAQNNFDPTSDEHIWLHTLITDSVFNASVRYALAEDINALNNILAKYYWSFKNDQDQIPLEIYHAKSQISDYIMYIEFFKQALTWNLDE